MKVIKKDGRIQDFDINKILITLEKVSDEIEEPFTESDIKNLSEDIMDSLKAISEDTIEVNSIQDVVVKQLENLGFTKAAVHYSEYRKEKA